MGSMGKRCCIMAGTLWGDLTKFLNDVCTEGLRDSVYLNMKDFMPSRSGTKKSFYTSNRKKGIITIPFPDVYRIHNEYPRLMGYSTKLIETNKTCSTLIGVEKNYKKVLIQLLNQKLKPYNLVFQEWDLSACHTKVLISLYPDQTPTIRSVFSKDESIWDEFAKSFSDLIIEAIGGPSVLKAWSKIIAYKCLQVGSVSYDGIKASLDPKGLSKLDSEDQEIIIQGFQDNPVLKEFNTVNSFLKDKVYLANYIMNQQLKIYHPTSPRPIVLAESDIDRKSNMFVTDNLCRLASQIVVGGENFVIMMALEVLRERKLRFIPVIYEYDGFCVLVEIDKANETINELNTELQYLLKQSHLFEMTFEQKLIG